MGISHRCRVSISGLAACMLLFISPARAQDDEQTSRSHHPARPASQRAETRRKGLLYRAEGAFEGYTLLAPIRSTTTYLIDMDGKVVHAWAGRRTPGHSVYLLENGHLLRAERDPENSIFRAGGEGGIISEYTWEGERVWEYRFSSDRHLQHHDIEPLPGGNILLIAWERKNADEALDAGRDPAMLRVGELWSEQILEVAPERPRGGEIVWEWHVWDHLIQDHDPDKPNYGDPARHPERIDINAGGRPREMAAADRRRLEQLGYIAPPPRGPGRGGRRGGDRREADWLHINSVAYSAELDQIVVSVHNLNEIWIIDHGTTTPESADHSGGANGRGGDLLYRWGNPAVYRMGESSDRQLFGQHDAQWCDGVGDGGWGILVFNNGVGRGRTAPGPRIPNGFGRDPGASRGATQGVPGKEIYSSVDLVALPTDDSHKYFREPSRPFGPEKPTWSYGAGESDSDEVHFFSSFISGVQRLPNGNTLICSGEPGRVLEITAEGKRVWEYVCPFARPGSGQAGRGPAGGLGGGPPAGRRNRRRGPGGGSLFRATRLPPDHPGLVGRKLDPIEENG